MRKRSPHHDALTSFVDPPIQLCRLKSLALASGPGTKNQLSLFCFFAVSRWSRALRGTVCNCTSMTCRGEWLAASVPSCWVSRNDAAWPAPKGIQHRPQMPEIWFITQRKNSCMESRFNQARYGIKPGHFRLKCVVFIRSRSSLNIHDKECIRSLHHVTFTCH